MDKEFPFFTRIRHEMESLRDDFKSDDEEDDMSVVGSSGDMDVDSLSDGFIAEEEEEEEKHGGGEEVVNEFDSDGDHIL